MHARCGQQRARCVPQAVEVGHAPGVIFVVDAGGGQVVVETCRADARFDVPLFVGLVGPQVVQQRLAAVISLRKVSPQPLTTRRTRAQDFSTCSAVLPSAARYAP